MCPYRYALQPSSVPRPRRTLLGRYRTFCRRVEVFFGRLHLGRLKRDTCFACGKREPGPANRTSRHRDFPDLYDCGCIERSCSHDR